MAMTLDEALAEIAKHRGQRIVIPTMASVPVWFGLSNQPLDFTYMPSAMGLGLSWVVPFSSCFAFFLGAAAAWAWSKYNKRNA